jgi:hypothetical protein
MGLLNLFGKTGPTLLALPRGSFTVDRDGEILASTIPSAYPLEQIQEIAKKVLRAFKAAQDVGLPLSQLNIDYHGLRITARELRGGAVVFLAPAPSEPVEI